MAQGGDASPLAVLESDRPKRKPKTKKAQTETATAPASPTPNLTPAPPAVLSNAASPVAELTAASSTSAARFAAVLGVCPLVPQQNSPRDAPKEAQPLMQVTADPNAHRESKTFSLHDFFLNQPSGSITFTYHEDKHLLKINCEAISAAAIVELREFTAPFPSIRHIDKTLTPAGSLGKHKLGDLSDSPRPSQQRRLEDPLTPKHPRKPPMQHKSWQSRMHERRLRLGFPANIFQDAEKTPTKRRKEDDADDSLLSDPEDLPLVREMYRRAQETEEERNSLRSRRRAAEMDAYYTAMTGMSRTPLEGASTHVTKNVQSTENVQSIEHGQSTEHVQSTENVQSTGNVQSIEHGQSTEALPSTEPLVPKSTSLPAGGLSPVAESSMSAGGTVQSPETPRSSRWGIGKFFSSARSYLPGTRRDSSSTSPSPQHHFQSEPRARVSRDNAAAQSSVSDFSQRLRDSHPSKRKSFRTKESIDEIKKVKAEKARLDEEWKLLEKEKETLARQQIDVEKAHRALYGRKQGEKKRKVPSPEVIPNPPGVSYGIDDDYFCCDSSFDSEENSPLGNPNKRSRIEGPDSPSTAHQISALGSTGKANDVAIPYNGVFFTDKPANTFQDDSEKAKQDKKAEQDRELAKQLDAQEAEDRERVAKWKEWERARRTPAARNKLFAPYQSVLEEACEEEPPQDAMRSAVQAPQQPIPVTKPTEDLSKPRKEASTAVPAEVTDVANRTPFEPAQNKSAPLLSAGVRPDEILKSKRAVLRENIAALNLPTQVQSPPHSFGSRTKEQQRTIGSALAGSATQSQLGASNSNQQEKDGGLSILGAATRAPPQKRNEEILSETLLGSPSATAAFDAYNEYAKSHMDPKVADLIEKTWTGKDSEIASSEFEKGFASSVAKQQNDGRRAEVQAKAKGFQGADSGDVDLGAESEASDVHSSGPATPVLPAADEFNMDPVVRTLLDSSWTEQDTKHAVVDFEERFRAYTQSNQ